MKHKKIYKKDVFKLLFFCQSIYMIYIRKMYVTLRRDLDTETTQVTQQTTQNKNAKY